MTKDLYTMLLGDEVVLGDFGKLPSAVVCVGGEAVRYVPERMCHTYSHGCLVIGGVETFFRCWSCSECHYGWHVSDNDKPYSYCPNCGAKVVN